MRNVVRFWDVFRVCRTLEAFYYTLHTHQQQNIHFQHKIKIEIFFDLIFIRFWAWFTPEKVTIFAVKSYLLLHAGKKEGVYGKNHHFFGCKSSSKSDENQVENIFIFMLQMYLLSLVIACSVWERLCDPIDSKKHQNLHCISHIPL